MNNKCQKFNIKNRKSSGFTLVELLAVMIVFIAVGSIIMAILVATLRGNNKTNALNSVRSNGQYAISQLARSIRNASTLIAPFPCGSITSPTATSAVELAFPDGSVSTYSCQDSQGNLTIASNSAPLIDTSAITVAACQFTCGQSSPSDYPVIGIDFFLKTKGTNLVEQQASASAIEFQTSVVIRNLLR